MAHVPHLYVPAPWGDDIALDSGQVDHVARVLRRAVGSEVSYTDGQGTVGSGMLGRGVITRGSEDEVPHPRPRRCLAVAPLRSKARNRMIVEKAAELGVDELTWVRSRYSQAPAPADVKALSWAAAALEQSRGAWLMRVTGPQEIDALEGRLFVAERGGPSTLPGGLDSYTILVGPEGGFSNDELPAGSARVSFSDRVLRTETAAILAAAMIPE